MSSPLVNVVVLLAISSFGQGQVHDTPPPKVTTKYGPIVGKVLSTSRGQCDAYLGVPFAQPPIGDLRWQKPQVPKAWTEPRNATQPGPRCVQLGSSANEQSGDSEDCLVLNVFAPQGAQSKKLPVMVFIHGGAFIFGSAQDYGYEGPCENLATRDVILVIVQYRLFMYGFFSTGDTVAPGNYGLWDQIAALQWVKDNIANFGGDPDKVTVFGESAGAASVSYLTYAPAAKDLFHQSLAESGSVYSFWAIMSDASIATARRVATAAKCTDSDSASYVKCLQQLPTVDLQRIYNAIDGLNAQMFYETWNIRVDGDLYTSSDLRELDTHRPAIIGLNSMETPIPNITEVSQGYAILNFTLGFALPSTDNTLRQILDQTARYVYIDSKGSPYDEMFVYEQAQKMQADLGFHAAASHEVMLKKASGSPTWVYKFDYWSDNVFPADYPFEKGAPHAHELCYIFLIASQPDKGVVCPSSYNDAETRRVANSMGEMWTNYAKTGDPSPASLHWPQFVDLANASAMAIRADLSIEPQYYLEVTNFWYELNPTIRSDFTEEPNSTTTSSTTPSSTTSKTASSNVVRPGDVWVILSTIMVALRIFSQ